MGIILTNLPFLLKGLVNTILLSIVCLIVSMLFGILFGVLRTVKNPVIFWIAKIYVEVFRGLPVMVTLFLIFFTLPVIGININTFFSAMIGLSLWTSANIAETVRGAIQSIAPAQTEASYSLGLNYMQTMRYVIMPQAARRMLPSVIGLLSNLIQATSLTVLIGNRELLKSAQIIIERIEVMNGISIAFAIYGVVLIGYFIVCYPLSIWSKKLEKKLKVNS
jgi:polar amino acid transport system permease protein